MKPIQIFFLTKHPMCEYFSCRRLETLHKWQLKWIQPFNTKLNNIAAAATAAAAAAP